MISISDISILSEILYVGFCYEKGRVFTNTWKPWYKKMLLKQLEIWKELNRCIMYNDISKMQTIINNLSLLCKKYKLPNYEMYLNSELYGRNGDNVNILSDEQNNVVLLIDALLLELEEEIKSFHNKYEIIHTIRALHNLPRALFSQSKINSRTYMPIECNEAIDYAFNNMSNPQKLKYESFRVIPK